MGFMEIRKGNDEVTPDLHDKQDNLLVQAIVTLDIIAELYKEFMQAVTPIGETNQLHDLTDIFSDDTLSRWIISEAPHFDWIVPGHAVYGPIFSDKQRRWWFWYLNNVLGGEYTNNAMGKTGPNDYPQIAFDMAEGDVNAEAEEFLNWIVT